MHVAVGGVGGREVATDHPRAALLMGIALAMVGAFASGRAAVAIASPAAGASVTGFSAVASPDPPCNGALHV